MKHRKTLPLPRAGQLVLSVDETVALSGLGRSTIQNAINDGKLPSLMIGRRRLVRRDDLDRFLSPEQKIIKGG